MKINVFDLLDDDIIGIDEKTVIIPTKASVEKIRKEAISMKTSAKKKNTAKRIIMLAAAAAIITAGCIVTAISITGAQKKGNNLTEIDYTIPEQSEAVERVREESAQINNKFRQEDMENSEPEVFYDEYGFPVTNANAKAPQKMEEYRINELLEIMKREGHVDQNYSYSDMQNTDDYAEFIILCCETYNDPNVKLTLDEQIKFYNILDKAYNSLYDGDDTSDIRIKACKTIEKTITPQSGYNQHLKNK